jgi:hypothetical protein
MTFVAWAPGTWAPYAWADGTWETIVEQPTQPGGGGGGLPGKRRKQGRQQVYAEGRYVYQFSPRALALAPISVSPVHIHRPRLEILTGTVRLQFTAPPVDPALARKKRNQKAIMALLMQ